MSASAKTQSLMRHDETWKLEIEPRQDVKVSRLSQDWGMKNHVSRQFWDETRVSRLQHWSRPTSLLIDGLHYRNHNNYRAFVSNRRSSLRDGDSDDTTTTIVYSPLSGTTRVSRYQKKHSPTHHPDHHPIFISFFYVLRSTASSQFKLRAWQSFCITSPHVPFGLPLGVEPSTSYSIHFFTKSVSSFLFCFLLTHSYRNANHLILLGTTVLLTCC